MGKKVFRFMCCTGEQWGPTRCMGAFILAGAGTGGAILTGVGVYWLVGMYAHINTHTHNQFISQNIILNLFMLFYSHFLLFSVRTVYP